MNYKKGFYTLLGTISLFGFYAYVESNKNAILLVNENQKQLAAVTEISELVLTVQKIIKPEVQKTVSPKLAARNESRLIKLKSGKEKLADNMYYKNKKHFDDFSFEEMEYAIEKEFKKIYQSESL